MNESNKIILASKFITFTDISEPIKLFATSCGPLRGSTWEDKGSSRKILFSHAVFLAIGYGKWAVQEWKTQNLGGTPNA